MNIEQTHTHIHIHINEPNTKTHTYTNHQNLCEKAMECIKKAEEVARDPKVVQYTEDMSRIEPSLSTSKLTETFVTAKFKVHCTACDWKCAG